MSTEYPSPLLNFAYRADLDILVGRWGYQPDPRELPAVYQQLTDVALENRAGSGCRTFAAAPSTTPPPRTGCSASTFPDMARRLGGRLFVAYLVGPALHEAIISQPDYVSAEAYDDKPYAISFFGDEGAAIRWLQIQQTDKVRY